MFFFCLLVVFTVYLSFTVYFKFLFIYLFIYIIYCFCNYYIFIFDYMCACMELLIEFRCTCTMTIKLSILFYSILYKRVMGLFIPCCWLLRGIAVHGSRANSGVSPSPRGVQAVSGRGLWGGGLHTSGGFNVTIVIHYN